MYSDSHVHTVFSGDSVTPVREQIHAAILKGMAELCITDHHDFDVDTGDEILILEAEPYLAALRELQEIYQGRIQLRIGIEFGQQSHLVDYARKFFSKYSFDYVIGSTHYVDGKDPYHPNFFEGCSRAEAYRRYFQALAENVKLFDTYDAVGHLDYVVRYGRKQQEPYDYLDYPDYLDEILRTIIAKGKGLECNTGGLRHGLGEPNPCRRILRRFKELGGEIVTLGSDAHVSKDIGFGFEGIGELLRSCGFAYYATYAERKAIFHRL